MRWIWGFGEDLPCDISSIENTQPDCVLVVSKVGVCLESQDFCVADIGAVYERAEEEQRENGQKSGFD
jgi:hypothetical protein